MSPPSLSGKGAGGLGGFESDFGTISEIHEKNSYGFRCVGCKYQTLGRGIIPALSAISGTLCSHSIAIR